MSRYHLGVMLEPVKIGQKFKKWPLHITLIPWFKFSGDPKKLYKWLEEVANNIKPFKVITNEKIAKFGRNHDVPVRLLMPSNDLIKLQAQLYHLLKSKGIVAETNKYNTLDFKPHITMRGSRFVPAKKEFKIDNISLVADLQDGKMGRKLIRQFKLGN